MNVLKTGAGRITRQASPAGALVVITHTITTTRGTYTHAVAQLAGETLIFWSTIYRKWWPCESARQLYGLRAHQLADEFNANWRIAA